MPYPPGKERRMIFIKNKTAMILQRITIQAAILVVTLLLSTPLSSQNVKEVFSETHSDQVFLSKWGPNKKHYATGFMRLSAPVSVPSSQAVKIPGSLDFSFGGRYKRRFCNFYSTGLDVYYSSASYNMKNPGELLTVAFMSDIEQERFANHSISGAWYQRFNIGRRGDHLGKYFEAGVYGQYHFSVKHRFKGKDEGFEFKAVSRFANLTINRSVWGLQAGIGFNALKLFAQYRMSDYLKNGYSAVDVPLLRLGLEIDLGS